LPLVPLMPLAPTTLPSPRALPLAAALLAGFAAWFAVAPTLAAALPEPALRLSPTLSSPRPVSSEDRSLLRVEWKAARSGVEEAEDLALLMQRVERMNGTVNDLHRLIAAMPTPGASRPAPAVAETPTSPDGDDALPWPVWLAGAAALAGIGLLWARRRNAAQMAQMAAAIPVLRDAAPQEPAVATHERMAMPHSIRPHRAEPHWEPTPPPPAPQAAFDPNATLIDAVPTVPKAPAHLPAAPPGAEPETAQTLELAEIMLSMGLTEGAAEALTDHIRVHPRQALYHWLKLLDVYRATGKRDEFQRTAAELRHSFNVQAADWGDHAGRHGIEDYPHISAGITNTWRKPGSADYLHSLLEDNRGGTRAGFPEQVAEEILLLLALLKDD